MTAQNIPLKKRILVTGGAGFLGSHLCDKLLAQGHDVLCLDNYFTGSKDNIRHLIGNPNFELIRHDVTEPILLEVDQIYNLACPASPIHYQHNAVKTIKTSVMGAINMLGLAKRVGARILQASTSEVYEATLKSIPKEKAIGGMLIPSEFEVATMKANAWQKHCFSITKRMHGLDIRIIRIFNTYGPRMHPDDGRVVSNFIVQALKNKDITVYGKGNQTRSFCYVDDLLDGMMRLMNTDDFVGPVNIGNPNEFTIRQLAKNVIDLTGSKSKMIEKPLPEDDPKQRKPDISLAQEKLGWQPTINLKEGLEKTIAYFNKSI